LSKQIRIQNKKNREKINFVTQLGGGTPYKYEPKKNICLFWVNFFVISKENSYVQTVKNLLKSNLQQQIDGILTNLNKMLVKFYDSTSILSSINLLL